MVRTSCTIAFAHSDYELQHRGLTPGSPGALPRHMDPLSQSVKYLTLHTVVSSSAGNTEGADNTCAHHGCSIRLKPPLILCRQCGLESYCSGQCERKAWAAGHRRDCLGHLPASAAQHMTSDQTSLLAKSVTVLC